MSLVTKPKTLTNGTVAQATDVESNFSTIYNDYNGNIDNTNLAASAAIADTKLAQITTYNKVSGAAIGSLASISSAAGLIPAANIPLLAALSTASQGSVVYMSATTAVVALAAGVSGTLLMSSNTTANPVFSKASLNSVTSILGAWASKNKDTSYQAATDGIIVSTANASSGTLSIKTDASDPPTTVRASTYTTTSGSSCVTVPVRKGDYYLIEATEGAATITSYWIPLGS